MTVYRWFNTLYKMGGNRPGVDNMINALRDQAYRPYGWLADVLA